MTVTLIDKEDFSRLILLLFTLFNYLRGYLYLVKLYIYNILVGYSNHI